MIFISAFLLCMLRFQLGLTQSVFKQVSTLTSCSSETLLSLLCGGWIHGGDSGDQGEAGQMGPWKGQGKGRTSQMGPYGSQH